MKRNEKAIIQSGKRQTQAKEEQHGQNLTQPLLHLRLLLHVPSPQFHVIYLVHAKISPEKGCHGGGWEFPLAATMNMSLFASVSSPVARNHRGKFELIIRERGDEGSSFPSLPTHALHTLVPIIPLLCFSLVSSAHKFPNPHLHLGKPVEEAVFTWKR